MGKDFDINTLFEIAFGIRSVAAYRINGTDNRPDGAVINYKNVTVTDDITEASRLSYLGTPIIFPITLKGKNYQVYNSDGEIVTKSYQDFELPAATLVNFRQAKIIRRTKIAGNSGTIKELYGADDWSIDIRGLCLADPSHKFAKTAVQQQEALVDFNKIFDSIEVDGALFLLKGIRNLVIESIDFKQLQGKPNIMPFMIRAKSDEPEELIIL